MNKMMQRVLAKEYDIQIKDEYSSLVPPLSRKEYDALKMSIKENNGNTVPIILNRNHVIIDGHHRLRACTELGLVPKTEVIDFANVIQESEFVINLNLNRRQLNDFQKAELGHILQQIEKERARARQISSFNNVKLSLGSNDHNEKGRVVDIISKKIHMSPKTYQRCTKIIELAPESIKQKLREGLTTISKEYAKIMKEQRRTQLMSEASKIKMRWSHNCKLFNGDFEVIGKKIPDNSVDLIFTDPPYGINGLELYEKLGWLTNRVLKEGGNLVTYSGQFYLNEVFKNLESTGLKYWWTLCVKHAEDHQLIYARNVFCEWKPLLWFVKGEKPNIINKISDHIESKQPEKLTHKMEQGIIEAEYIIKHLTVENQIVFDPMMGSATSCIAALANKRKFIGCENDKSVFELAKRRISQYLNDNANLIP
jgi:DNA modification methylase/ParB-like chromosome segregation protein Spo0J